MLKPIEATVVRGENIGLEFTDPMQRVDNTSFAAVDPLDPNFQDFVGADSSVTICLSVAPEVVRLGSERLFTRAIRTRIEGMGAVDNHCLLSTALIDFKDDQGRDVHHKALICVNELPTDKTTMIEALVLRSSGLTYDKAVRLFYNPEALVIGRSEAGLHPDGPSANASPA